MEGRPRYGAEQPDENSEDDQEQTGRRLRRLKNSEGYWRRLLGETPQEEPNKAEKLEDEDEEDDDDDDELGNDNKPENKKETSRSWIDRYSKLRKRKIKPSLLDIEKTVFKEEQEQLDGDFAPEVDQDLSPFVLPDAESVKEDALSPYSELPVVSNETDIEQSFELHSTEEAANTIEELTGQLQQVEAKSEDMPLAVSSVEASSLVNEIIDPPSDREEIPAVERLEDILKRQNLIDRVESSREDFNIPLKAPETSMNIKSNQDRGQEIYDSGRVNNGLHLLSYGLALRRDKRNQKINNQEFKKVNTKIDNLDKTLYERQQKDLKNLDNVGNKLTQEFPKAELLKSKDVEKTSKIIEQNRDEIALLPNTSELVEKRLKELINQDTSEIEMRPSIEFIDQLNRSPELSKAIESELQLDRKHEVMDNSQIASNSNSSNSNDSAITSFTNDQKMYSKPGSLVDRPLDNSLDKEKYREVVTSGVWGAVVGGIVFVLFYILTSR